MFTLAYVTLAYVDTSTNKSTVCQDASSTQLKGYIFVYFRKPRLDKPTPVSDTSTVLAAGSLQSLYEATPASWTEEQPDDEDREESKDTKVNE